MKTFFSPLLFLAFVLMEINTYAQNSGINGASSFKQKEILSYREIDSVLNTFEKVPYKKLDKEYYETIGYEGRPDENKVADKYFYKLIGRDVFKNLVGNFIVNEFLPKDKYWKETYSLADSNYVQYLFIDTQVLYRFLDLILLMKKSGYNTSALKIMDGYRYPAFNKATGGAGFSQHIYGKAIDIEVGDINNDSIVNEKNDKKIIIELLDKKIIKKSGGIGLYPGTQIVHFDTRGKYARWNEQ